MIPQFLSTILLGSTFIFLRRHTTAQLFHSGMSSGPEMTLYSQSYSMNNLCLNLILQTDIRTYLNDIVKHTIFIAMQCIQHRCTGP